ncbi:MAG: NYN domain-containing protein [Gemmatimonadaceae bacterium]|nr:NYN domain-containing protein [Gemmatimonadaceae bacterium]
MNPRNTRTAPARPPVAPMHRGPQAISPGAHFSSTPIHHAPNAALLIDFDNVTMGIRSDLGNELRNLLSSDIIKGKVAVQRAYADWRRYPQYVVPLTESSIDLIFAVAYGSAKKNATDIRLAIDATELIFTRPEIGTFILLSGDSDFTSLVLKLKEYGKYVIGVGIRESSSDLLVMSCDEYYSYNALAGLVKTNEDEQVKWDPWELVVEALARMKQNGDVMRSDRLKQVMQDIDSNFDEKNIGMSKFSRFVQEASTKGLIKLTRMENGQLEVSPTDRTSDVAPRALEAPRTDDENRASVTASQARVDRESPRVSEGGERSRGGRGRGRGRGRTRGEVSPVVDIAAQEPRIEPIDNFDAPPLPPIVAAAEPAMAGERLTRDEAFELVRRSITELTLDGSESARASDVRRKARELLGRDSETLSERFFTRILRDAHDVNVIDLRKRGDDYEVSPAASAQPISQQLVEAEAGATPAPSASQAGRSAATAGALRRGIRSRGVGGRGGSGEMPPELLSLGIVESAPSPVSYEPVFGAPVFAAADESALATTSDASEESVDAGADGAKRPAAKKRARGTRSASKSPAAKGTRSRSRKTATASAEAAPPAPAVAESGAAKSAKRRRPRARRKATAGSDG